MTRQRLRHQWRYTRDTVRDTVYDLRRPESRSRMAALQVGKSTLAAIVAWYLASEVFGSQAAWLAPMTAVLMVHSTVYRSISEGVRRVVAVAVGAMLSALVGTMLGLSALSLLVVVPLSLLAARLPWIRAQGEYITVTAVVLLTFGMFSEQGFLLSYVVDTAVGAVVGTLVNAFVFPPGYQRSARAAVSDLASHEARTLRDVADGTREGWTYDQAETWRHAPTGCSTRQSRHSPYSHGVKRVNAGTRGPRRNRATMPGDTNRPSQCCGTWPSKSWM